MARTHGRGKPSVLASEPTRATIRDVNKSYPIGSFSFPAPDGPRFVHHLLGARPNGNRGECELEPTSRPDAVSRLLFVLGPTMAALLLGGCGGKAIRDWDALMASGGVAGAAGILVALLSLIPVVGLCFLLLMWVVYVGAGVVGVGLAAVGERTLKRSSTG